MTNLHRWSRFVVGVVGSFESTEWPYSRPYAVKSHHYELKYCAMANCRYAACGSFMTKLA